VYACVYMYRCVWWCIEGHAPINECTRILSVLSSICRLCAKKGEGYKYCSKCT
jgi:hypothetical protein